MTPASSISATLPAFTPTAVPAEVLLERTVGRDEVIERLVSSIRAAATSGARPHTLVVGPRGSGKTHLLTVVLHRATTDADIANKLAVAAIPEDALEVASYDDLLVSAIERLEPRAPDAPPATEARPLRASRDTGGLERLLERAVGDRLLILVIENLNRVFGDLGETQQARLRSFTETNGNVLILASTPLLFSGVSDHARPWYGSFDVEHLGELAVDEGADLLRRVALRRGDDELVRVLGTRAAQTRLRAVARLAGGSPRMWMVLAGLQTVELLEDLVPLVEAMLDELVPYYQQRLLELAPVERRIVVELARADTVGLASGRAVGDIADAIGVSERVAATALSRLHKSRWVRRTKPDARDKRKTWYEVREPLLRHHLQYREARGQPLRVIVGFLQSWYSLEEQRRHLANAEPGSIVEVYLRDALSLDVASQRVDALFADTSAESLIAAARTWLREGSLSSLAAIVAEAIGMAARDGLAPAEQALERRLASRDDATDENLRTLVATGMTAAANNSAGLTSRIGAGLEAAADAAAGGLVPDDDSVALDLLAAGWRSRTGGAAEALRRLEVRPLDEASVDPRLALAVSAEVARCHWELGDRAVAVELEEKVVKGRWELLGPTHPDTIAARATHATSVGVVGGAGEALQLWEALARDCETALGVAHDETLRALTASAVFAMTLPASDHGVAIAQRVVEARERLHGPEAEQTIRARITLAAALLLETGKTPADLEELAREAAEILGQSDRDTLNAHALLAAPHRAAGRIDEVREIYSTVFEGSERLEGRDTEATITAGAAYAWAMAETGQERDAIVLASDLLPRHRSTDENDQTLILLLEALASASTSLAVAEGADGWVLARLAEALRDRGPIVLGTWLLLLARSGVPFEPVAELVVAVVREAGFAEELAGLVVAGTVEAGRRAQEWIDAWRVHADEGPALALAATALEALRDAQAGNETAIQALPTPLRDALIEQLDQLRSSRATS